MPDSPIDLAAYRKRRRRELREDARAPGPGEVPCPRCKAAVFRTATRCGSCGVHFKGRAEDFAPRQGRSLAFRLVLGLLLLVLLVAALGF